MATPATYREPARDLPVAFEHDAIVCGGGVAGIAAALGAAREGARVLLVERSGMLGGAATGGLMHSINAEYRHVSGILRELADTLAERGAATRGMVIGFDPDALKALALELMADAGVTLLLHTWIADVARDAEARPAGIVIENKSGRQAALAPVVIDASGDGDVCAAAGASFSRGRASDGKMRPITLLFRVGGVDVDALLAFHRAHPEHSPRDPSMNMLDPDHHGYAIYGFEQLIAPARERGEVHADCHWIGLQAIDAQKGTVLVNATNVYADGTDARALTAAEAEGRRQGTAVHAFLRNHIPGFERSYIWDFAASAGVRETRNVEGDYVLTREDIDEDRSFEDTVAIDHLHVHDAHNPGGQSDADIKRMLVEQPPLKMLQVPYRCLLPRGVDDLLVAGRCISATHEAQAFTRFQGCCISTGQAAGVAAAQAAAAGVPPRDLDVAAIQRSLVAQGVALPAAGSASTSATV